MKNYRIDWVQGSSPLTRGKPPPVPADLPESGLIPAHAGKTVAVSLACAACEAHPRSRGENLPSWFMSLWTLGSSPLTRGKRFLDAEGPGDARLIPAHAGKTRIARASGAHTKAHPRSRGENFTYGLYPSMAAGSSPLTRGKLGLWRCRGVLRGLIPAHAGKTGSRGLRGGHCRAHPRSRGENWSIVRLSLVRLGSSPLTRGKPAVVEIAEHCDGLIPAHAGKTGMQAHRLAGKAAHPRSRGENFRASCLSSAVSGSSPLTRGKRPRHPRPLAGLRLIPAHAGKTQVRAVNEETRSAHPRSRGENIAAVNPTFATVGSSPLTRGKPRGGRHVDLDTGLIPAHAGKTTVRAGRAWRSSAHPRSRGENGGCQVFSGLVLGSSPLTRGKLTVEVLVAQPVRLIPAHAGKTCRDPSRRTIRRAHPRSRGENKRKPPRRRSSTGSSPLTRGKLFSRRRSRSGSGLIPAHAGKTH